MLAAQGAMDTTSTPTSQKSSYTCTMWWFIIICNLDQYCKNLENNSMVFMTFLKSVSTEVLSGQVLSALECGCCQTLLQLLQMELVQHT